MNLGSRAVFVGSVGGFWGVGRRPGRGAPAWSWGASRLSTLGPRAAGSVGGRLGVRRGGGGWIVPAPPKTCTARQFRRRRPGASRCPCQSCMTRQGCPVSAVLSRYAGNMARRQGRHEPLSVAPAPGVMHTRAYPAARAEAWRVVREECVLDAPGLAPPAPTGALRMMLRSATPIRPPFHCRRSGHRTPAATPREPRSQPAVTGIQGPPR